MTDKIMAIHHDYIRTRLKWAKIQLEVATETKNSGKVSFYSGYLQAIEWAAAEMGVEIED